MTFVLTPTVEREGVLIFSERSKRKEKVRKDLIMAGTKQKKGFMTPERKKKLRVRRAL